jgi:hypothetical protein
MGFKLNVRLLMGWIGFNFQVSKGHKKNAFSDPSGHQISKTVPESRGCTHNVNFLCTHSPFLPCTLALYGRRKDHR